MKSTISVYLFVIIFGVFLFTCGENTKKPTDYKDSEEKPVASAGPDQTIEAGNFALIDVSASSPKEPGNIKAFAWMRDENNPTKPTIYEDSTGKRYFIGFTEIGNYNFFLYAITENEYSEPDTLTVTVNERTSPLIEDVNLELLLRYRDNFYRGPITESYLAGIDSLSYEKKSVISSVNGLGYCTNLKYLDMSWQKITQITDLGSLPELEYLNLSQNTGLKTISTFQNPNSFKYLNLEKTAINDLSFLENAISLKYLYVDSSSSLFGMNKLTALTNLEELKLKNLARTNRTDISFAINLNNLKILWLKLGVITDISPVENLIGLNDLNFEDNDITELSSLEKLINLEKLSLKKNRQLTDISSLQKLPDLKELILNMTRVSDIKPLVDNQGIGADDYLDLTSSRLDSLSKIIYIPELVTRGVVVDY